jgi:hypothetical protein
MTFTVRDFHDLVEILEVEPVWRAELRRLILTDDILGLPEALRQLTENVNSYLESQRSYEKKSDERFGRIEGDIHQLKTDVSQLKTDMGRVDGRTLEQQVRDRLPTYLSRFALRLRKIKNAHLAELLETAAEEGRISEEEVEEAKLIDALARGRRRADGATIYLAVEISTTVNEHDLERAARRAKIIAQATNSVTLPVVVGTTIREEMRRLIDTESAGYVLVPQE